MRAVGVCTPGRVPAVLQFTCPRFPRHCPRFQPPAGQALGSGPFKPFQPRGHPGVSPLPASWREPRRGGALLWPTRECLGWLVCSGPFSPSPWHRAYPRLRAAKLHPSRRHNSFPRCPRASVALAGRLARLRGPWPLWRMPWRGAVKRRLCWGDVGRGQSRPAHRAGGRAAYPATAAGRGTARRDRLRTGPAAPAGGGPRLPPAPPRGRGSLPAPRCVVGSVRNPLPVSSRF